MYLQPWMNTAHALIGTREAPGRSDNPHIMQWAAMTGLNDTYTADSIPWCGLFTAFVLDMNGIRHVDKPLWALNWNKFGTKLNEPAFGAIMVFKRNGGGHVGFAVSQDKYNYHILGGNQSDMVSIAKVAKARCVGYRWPTQAMHLLQPGLPYSVLNSPVSRNEA